MILISHFKYNHNKDHKCGIINNKDKEYNKFAFGLTNVIISCQAGQIMWAVG